VRGHDDGEAARGVEEESVDEAGNERGGDLGEAPIGMGEVVAEGEGNQADQQTGEGREFGRGSTLIVAAEADLFVEGACEEARGLRPRESATRRRNGAVRR
jgi:hypothetical protein